MGWLQLTPELALPLLSDLGCISELLGAQDLSL